MDSRFRELLLRCESMDFAKSELPGPEASFYRRFSSEMVSLCRSLPVSAQTDSMLFLMRYSGLKLGDDPDFFANYYPPTWSVLYWIGGDHPLATERLNEEDLANAVTGHSMGMFLHSLDDHLTDCQVAVTPLTLLLRSQAWTIMNRAFGRLAEGITAGERIVRGFVDDYYTGSQNLRGVKSIDNYCDQFRKQMAIGMIAPILLTIKMTGMSDLTRDIEVAYGSFGIAWRLLDDIRDIGEDMEKGTESAIYLCLPEMLKTYWKDRRGRPQTRADDCANAILNYVLEHGLIERIKKRICAELENAASAVQAHDMESLAAEFRCLAHPLRTGGNT